jgi:hypothetical protein
MQGEVDIGQQQALAPAQGEITEGNHAGIIASAGAAL